MKCNKCGCNVESKNKFCPNCGNQLENTGSNNLNLAIAIFLLLFMPLIGIIFCILMMKSDGRFKKVLLYYIVITIVFFGGLILLAFSLASIFSPSNDPSSRDYKCSNFCNGEYAIENYYCVCRDGRSYDMFPEREEKNNSDDNNDGDDELIKTEFDKYDWINTISSNQYVINVISATWCSDCQDYKPIIKEAAKKKQIKLYFIEIDRLSSDDYTIYTTLMPLKEFKQSVPYTFITFNGEVLNETGGKMDIEETLKFINNTMQS